MKRGGRKRDASQVDSDEESSDTLTEEQGEPIVINARGSRVRMASRNAQTINYVLESSEARAAPPRKRSRFVDAAFGSKSASATKTKSKSSAKKSLSSRAKRDANASLSAERSAAESGASGDDCSSVEADNEDDVNFEADSKSSTEQDESTSSSSDAKRRAPTRLKISRTSKSVAMDRSAAHAYHEAEHTMSDSDSDDEDDGDNDVNDVDEEDDADADADADAARERRAKRGRPKASSNGVASEAIVIDDEESEIKCTACGSPHAADLLLCDEKGCENATHLRCANPRLPCVPPGEWRCAEHGQEPYCEQCRKAVGDDDLTPAKVCTECFAMYHEECAPDTPADCSEPPPGSPWRCDHCIDVDYADIERLYAKRFRPKRVHQSHASQPDSQSVGSAPVPPTSYPAKRAPASQAEAAHVGEVRLRSPYEYFVKYVGLGNVHCRWIPEHRVDMMRLNEGVGAGTMTKLQNKTWTRKFGVGWDKDRDILIDLFSTEDGAVMNGINVDTLHVERIVDVRWRHGAASAKAARDLVAAEEAQGGGVTRIKHTKAGLKKKRRRKSGGSDSDSTRQDAPDATDPGGDGQSQSPGGDAGADAEEVEETEEARKERFDTESLERELLIKKYGGEYHFDDTELRRRAPLHCEFLVKWASSDYDMCTWERGTLVLGKLGARDLVERFFKYGFFPKYVHMQRKVSKFKGKRKDVPKLKIQPAGLGDRRLRLHHFQLEGLNWMRFNWAQRRSCILADEMGLGKTIQTIGLVVALQKFTMAPSLIVVPLSTVPNWIREFGIWAPHLNVISYIGNEASRQLLRKNEFYFMDDNGKSVTKDSVKFNVIVTSYEMITRTEAAFKRVPFEALIVDEAHRLKAGKSGLLFRKLNEHSVKFRVLLTGTPLQNNLSELFNLLEFLQPDEFQRELLDEEFAEMDKKDAVAKIHEILQPRMLRRYKKDVFDDLPKKTELIVPVDMSYFQRTYYKALLERNYEVLSSKRKTHTSLLNVVMQLRKCCNHPYLFEGAEPEPTPETSEAELLKRMLLASGKMLVLDKMLMRLKETGHRVLIFSQMTRVLDILEDYCHYRRFNTQRVDGGVSSLDRQMRIDAFNRPDSNDFIFLLSTRAGGQGINLATADTVVTFDSDYNPHNDIQAFARAHRLGQKNKVMIYRLITRNSVEERLIEVAKHKLRLEHAVVGEAAQNTNLKLNADEYEEVLRTGVRELFGDEKMKSGGMTAAERLKFAALEEADEEATAGALHYDAEAIDKLLDRAQENTDDNEQQAFGEYLSAFKVANYGTVDGGDGGDGEAGGGGDDDENIWEELLREQFEEAERARLEEESRMFGKGKRVRRTVYNQEISDAQLREAGILYDGEEGSNSGGSSSGDADDSDASIASEHAADEELEANDVGGGVGGVGGGERLTEAQRREQRAKMQVSAKASARRRDLLKALGLGELHRELREEAAQWNSGTVVPHMLRMRNWFLPDLHYAPHTPEGDFLKEQAHSAHALCEMSKGTFNLTTSQRRAFLMCVLRHGLGDGSWRHISFYFPNEFRDVPSGTIRAYGDALVVHLLNPADHSWTERTRKTFMVDFAEDIALSKKLIMWRVFRLFQAQELVISESTQNQWRLPELERYVPNLKSGGGGRSMNALQNVWGPGDDRILMRSLCRFGFGRWRHILHNNVCSHHEKMPMSLFDLITKRAGLNPPFIAESARLRYMQAIETHALVVVKLRANLLMRALGFTINLPVQLAHDALGDHRLTAESTFYKYVAAHNQQVAAWRDERDEALSSDATAASLRSKVAAEEELPSGYPTEAAQDEALVTMKRFIEMHLAEQLSAQRAADAARKQATKLEAENTAKQKEAVARAIALEKAARAAAPPGTATPPRAPNSVVGSNGDATAVGKQPQHQ